MLGGHGATYIALIVSLAVVYSDNTWYIVMLGGHGATYIALIVSLGCGL